MQIKHYKWSLLLVIWVLTIFYTLPLCAQDFPTDRGSRMILGGFAFSSAGGELNSDGDNRLISLEVSSSYSYFSTPAVAFGGKLVISRLSQGKSSFTTFGIGPQILYFFGGDQKPATIKGKSYPYIGASGLYQHLAASGESANGFSFSFGAGFLSLLTNTVGFFGEAGYQFDSLSANGETLSGNKINIIAGFLFFLY
ncbi:MAG: hypothetical protein D6814_07035 [Calditrichaeota bacterium]|nr:MAG: hypothetical protein D6814_07035 [Calditrichota bacterium]